MHIPYGFGKITKFRLNFRIYSEKSIIKRIRLCFWVTDLECMNCLKVEHEVIVKNYTKWMKDHPLCKIFVPQSLRHPRKCKALRNLETVCDLHQSGEGKHCTGYRPSFVHAIQELQIADRFHYFLVHHARFLHRLVLLQKSERSIRSMFGNVSNFRRQ